MDKKPIRNAAWIIGCRIVRALLNMLVTMVSARYLGPSGFGLINYAASVVAFFLPIMMLGLNTTLVQELVEEPQSQGCTLGTAIILNLLSAVMCMAGAAAFVAVANPGEKDTLLVCILYSLNLPFQALELIQYWYQAELKAKYTSLTTLGVYVIVSVYKIILLDKGKSIYWFAVSQTLEYFLVSLVLMVLYHGRGGPTMSFSWQKAKAMLKKSSFYILSAMMLTVFAQTDKIMLKPAQGDAVVGFYSAAVTCAGLTGFVFSAIIDTARPLIFQEKKKGQEQFEQSIILLYSAVMFLALSQSIVISLSCEFVVELLYGSKYLPTVPILRILIWYTTFSYMGAVRTVWVLGEEKHGLLWKVNLCGALVNVILNSLFIPLWGAEGAALASLITQFLTNVLIGFILPELRHHNQLIVAALNPKFLVRAICPMIRR